MNQKPLNRMNGRFAIVAVLILLATAYIYFHSDIIVPTNRPLTTFPVQIGNWRMSGESFMTDQVINVLKPTDYLMRNYANDAGEKITLYVGYHGGGKESGEIHSPKQCLPGSGWNESYTQKTVININNKKIPIVRSVYQKGASKEIFIYWFQVMDKTLNNEYTLKFAEIINSAFYRRRDAAFIRVSIPFEIDEEKARISGENFVKDISPVLVNYLPK